MVRPGCGLHCFHSHSLGKTQACGNPQLQRFVGKSSLCWAATYTYDSIAMKGGKNGFERIISSFYHAYNPGNRDPNTGEQRR